MNGIILVKKPKGMTSFQCVSAVKRRMNERKAGHSGTLDPNAEGFMIIALGKCTKYLQFCVSNHKHYIAHFSLGKRYDTQDVWGKVVEEKDFIQHTVDELNVVSERFTGKIQQIPPMYSAIKKDGKKLYEYARNGIEVERAAREIEVNSLSVKQLEDNLYEMDAVVSSGTYIRTLIEDYCKAMNELGYMTSLVRSGIESLTLEDAVDIEEVDEKYCIDPLKVFDPKWKIVQCEQVQDIMNGKAISLNVEEKRVILVNGKEILAAYEKRSDGLYHCVRGLF
jgi:tRNA pseudouridine55 synthase